MPTFAEKLAAVRGEASPVASFEDRLAAARGPIAEKAAARLPQMTKDAASAQADVKNDTIARGVGQALGGAMFGLPAEAAAQGMDHPFLTAGTGGAYPIAAALLPGMVKSAGHQLAQAGNDVRTAVTGNAGPNAPPASFAQRGDAAVRVPVRLLSAALAPFGVAGVADQADALATADDPNVAIGRLGANAVMTAGAIPVSRLVKPSLQKSAAGLGDAANRQMIKALPGADAETADRLAPQLIDRKIKFATPQELTSKAAERFPVPDLNARQPIGLQPVIDVGDAAAAMPDGVRPVGDIMKSGGARFAKTAAKGAAGAAIGAALGRGAGTIGEMVGIGLGGLREFKQLPGIAFKTVQEVLASPQWNSAGALTKAAAANFLKRGDIAGATDILARGASVGAAATSAGNPQSEYINTLMRGASR